MGRFWDLLRDRLVPPGQRLFSGIAAGEHRTRILLPTRLDVQRPTVASKRRPFPWAARSHGSDLGGFLALELSDEVLVARGLGGGAGSAFLGILVPPGSMGAAGRDVPFPEIIIGSELLPKLPPSTPTRVEPMPLSAPNLVLRSFGFIVFIPFNVLKSTCAAGAPVPWLCSRCCRLTVS